MRILVLNGGSSSFKCAVYEFSAEPLAVSPPVWKATIDWDGANLTGALEPVLHSAGPVDLAGHRIVHGGERFRKTARITEEVHAAIAKLGELAPGHNQYELQAVDSVSRVAGPAVPQMAVFDTAFHATLAPAAYVYPGPYGWLAEGIRRYGFHGISYQYATRRTRELLGYMPQRLLLCHLGNGASLCAVRDGVSIDTTMGFTPLDGLMMGTRSGSVDPGILLHLLRGQCTADQLDHLLNRQSGLLGVSGRSADMRDILQGIKQGDARCGLAFDVYLHRLAREAGAMISVLGGLDAIAFTGGVGENSTEVRQALCDQLSFLELKLTSIDNAGPPKDRCISAADSKPILVVHAEEEWEIARECWRLATPREAPAS